MSRKAVYYFFNGESLTIKEISEKYRVHPFLVYKSFTNKNYPDLQFILDSRKALGIEDINDATWKPKNNKKFLCFGEYLTAIEISEKYKIPTTCVYYALCHQREHRGVSLENMILWRKQHGIEDLNNFQYSDFSTPDPPKYVKPSARFRFSPGEKVETIKPSLQENFYQPKKSISKPVIQKKLEVGYSFGSYQVIAVSKRGLQTSYTLYCPICDKVFSEVSQHLAISIIPSTGCCCNLFSHAQILKHLPTKLQNYALTNKEKDINFYKQFVGYKLCELKILRVSKKDSNDMSFYIFEGICEKCKRHFFALTFHLITGIFKHKCVEKNKAVVYKNTSTLKGGKFLDYYHNKITCHIHEDFSIEMLDMLQNHVGFYSREVGTESFMELLIDSKLTGVYDKFTNIYGDYF